MSSKSTKKPWSVSPTDYGRSLKGFGINLLVADVETSKKFAEDILLAHVVYWNEDIAIIRQGNAEWMLHADHSYSDNAYLGIAQSQEGRGAGAEFHLYDLDPDEAENRARQHDHIVFAGSLNKPHGLRECYLIDPDGYCWVISRPLTDEEVKEVS
ncbi:hypothetical protein [Curvivirga sp.]|uniref:hypothetical protein n=1 Tax=Curvivirga sp. TaxID=2856848 RepID=UPI003B5A6979